MTGSHTYNRSLSKKYLAILVIGLIAFSIIGSSSPVQAHHLKHYQKQRFHVNKRARSMQGTPYRYGGTSPNGFDCSGFTQWIYNGHGASLPHNSTSQFNLPKTSKKYKRVWKRSRLLLGDLVFHDTGSGRVGHAGMYVGKGKFISATSSGGVRVRSLYDSYWGPRWVGATRLPATMRYKP